MAVNTDFECLFYELALKQGLTPQGAAGLIGNLEAESDGFCPKRVEYLCMRRLKEFAVKDASGKYYTDDTYTAAIDSGRITLAEFQHPLLNSAKANAAQKNYQYGYGLAQWTTPSRKAGLYQMAKEAGVSIGNEAIQAAYVFQELRTKYTAVYNFLCKTRDIKQASDYVLVHFEQPADTGDTVKIARYSRAVAFWNNYVQTGKATRTTEGGNPMTEIQKIEAVAKEEIGYLEKATNAQLDSKTANAGYNNFTKYWRDVRKLGRLEYFGYEKDGTFAGGSNWPYCACGIEWAFTQALGLDRAKELLLHPKHAFINCETMYQYAKAAGRLIGAPKRGAIVLFHKGAGTQHYHTEFCYDVKDGVMYTVGWNTSGASSVIANGGGVCAKRYTVSSTKADYFMPAYKEAASETGTVDTGTAVTFLKYGSSGSAVADIQKKLIAMGYTCGSAGADGEFGADTLKAVKLYQENNDLEVDGIVGELTAGSINVAYQALTQKKTLDPVDSPVLFVGKAKADGVDVRTWAGREYGNIQSWPKLDKGNLVDVLDYTQKATDGEEWYFVRISNDLGTWYGFVQSKNIGKA